MSSPRIVSRRGSTIVFSFTLAGASTWPRGNPLMSMRNSDLYPR
jgi:hypothetical protein